MDFKALFLGLLALASLSKAMEPIEPIVQPAEQPQEHQSTHLTETERKKQTGCVSDEDQCMICFLEAKDLPAAQLQLTNCCQSLICKDCEKGVLEQPLLSAQCQKCRRENWTTRQAKLVPVEIKITDVYREKCTLNDKHARALLKCSALEAYTSHEGVLDFSKQTQHTFLTKDYIIRLAQIIADPKKERSGTIGPVLKMFEIAHYLGAPDNILFIIANELWPRMQDQTDDSAENKSYKKHVRQLARPHLASPKHLLNYLRINPAASNFFRDLHARDSNQKIQLSFTIIRLLSQLEEDWYTYNDSDWYMGYQFCSLDGIKELLAHLGARARSIDLSGHMLETFSSDIIEWMKTLDLSNNNIRQLTATNLERKNHLPDEIILNNNPINLIDESFFEEMRKSRATEYNFCKISIKNCNLSNKQKEEIRKKFYKATTTIPQRYLHSELFRMVFEGGGSLVGTAASLYACYKLNDYAPKCAKGISLTTAAILGGAIGCARESFFHKRDTSAPWLIFDAITGAALSSIAAYKILEKKPQLAKAIPMAYAGIVGAITGWAFGGGIGNRTANALHKLTHPEIEWKNENWTRGTYTIDL